MSYTPEKLAELKAVAEAATPGPWVTREHMLHDHDRWGQLMEIYTLERREECLPNQSKSPDVYGPDEEYVGDEPIVQVITNPPKDRCKADATHIATFSPPEVLALLAEIERLKTELREFKLVITGGEDAPGHADTLTLPEAERVMRKYTIAYLANDEAEEWGELSDLEERASELMCDTLSQSNDAPELNLAAHRVVELVNANFRAESDQLRAQLERAIEALGPFARTAALFKDVKLHPRLGEDERVPITASVGHLRTAARVVEELGGQDDV